MKIKSSKSKVVRRRQPKVIQLGERNRGRYTPDIGVVPEGTQVMCGICGDQMNEHRDCLGPRGFAQAMSGGKSPHDVFECPNYDERWHQQIVELLKEADNSPSAVLENIYRQEVELILDTREPTK